MKYEYTRIFQIKLPKESDDRIPSFYPFTAYGINYQPLKGDYSLTELNKEYPHLATEIRYVLDDMPIGVILTGATFLGKYKDKNENEFIVCFYTYRPMEGGKNVILHTITETTLGSFERQVLEKF